MSDIFISYAHEDHLWAELFAQDWFLAVAPWKMSEPAIASYTS